MSSQNAHRTPPEKANSRSRSGSGPSKPAPSRGGGGGAVVGGFIVAALVGGAVAWASGCRNEAPPGPSTEVGPHVNTLPTPPLASAIASAKPAIVAPSTSASTPAMSPSGLPIEKPYNGPLLGALGLQTAVYAKPEGGKKILGYVRLGGKVPVETSLVKDAGSKCTAGWYRLVDGGYVCAKWGTLDLNNP
ncbi:MAG: hypothetical protein ABJE95_32035, partial [Byssovorax sp.]